MPLLSTLLNATSFKSAFLSTIIPTVGLAFGIQAAFAVPSAFAQTERFYDLSGSLTYLSCTAFSLYLPTLRARAAASLAGKALPAFPSLLRSFGNASAGGANVLNWRQVALSSAVGFWSARLGSYLFMRIMKDGSDSRFDDIKKNKLSLFGAFMIQATWVSLCLLPVIAVNAIPSATLAALPALTLTDIFGFAIFAGGLTFEVIADRQKSQWVAEKKNKQHDEDFITRGLWSKSRHPNYFGEVTLWSGIALAASGVLVSSPAQAAMGLSSVAYGKAIGALMAGVSPAFIAFLLFKVSGIPLSENKYDKRYGHRKDYQQWKANTPLFFPKF